MAKGQRRRKRTDQPLHNTNSGWLQLQAEGATVTEIGQLLGGTTSRGKRELQAARLNLLEHLQSELREELLAA